VAWSSPVFVGLIYENIVDDEPMPWPPGDAAGGVDGREGVDKEGSEGALWMERSVCPAPGTRADGPVCWCSIACPDRPV
jgi:hypothetical protein